MGWWKISENMANGDEPADHMSDAINKIQKAYRKTFDRPPYMEELKAVFEFCVTSEDFPSSGEKLEHGPGINWEVDQMKKKREGWRWN
jgi:hypothetical protein